MDRWTLNELKNTDEITFAIKMLRDRQKTLNAYSPLSKKIGESIRYLEAMKREKDLFLERISSPARPADEDERFANDEWEDTFWTKDSEEQSVFPEKIPDRGWQDGCHSTKTEEDNATNLSDCDAETKADQDCKMEKEPSDV